MNNNRANSSKYLRAREIVSTDLKLNNMDSSCNEKKEEDSNVSITTSCVLERTL